MAESVIKKDFVGFNFGYEFYNGKQIFKNQWSLGVVVDEVVRLRHTGQLNDEEFAIIKFIFDHTMATAGIVRDYIRPDTPLEIVEDMLEKLVKLRFLNKFAITAFKAEEYPVDALDIYCLDYGGKKLLMHYGDPEDEVDKWTQSNVMLSVSRISEKLVSADFHVQLMKNCGEELVYIKNNPVYRKTKDPTVPAFEFCIKHNDGHKYFIGVIARETSLQPHFRDLVGKLDDLICSKAWKRYFYDEPEAPVLIVLAENDKVAVESAKIINARTSIKAVRYTTDDRIHQPLSKKGAFLKFVKEGESEAHPEAHLAAVKATFFAGRKE